MKEHTLMMDGNLLIQRAYQIIGEIVVGRSFDADQFRAMDEQINDLQLEVAALLPEKDSDDYEQKP